MKKISILFFTALSFFSCNDNELQGLFTLPILNLSFTVDPTIQPPGTFYIPINGVETNTKNLLAANGYELSEVTSIVPKAATLNVVFQDAKIDFIRNMSIRLCERTENSPNCGPEAFWSTDIPTNTGFSLGLNASAVDDLSDILLQDVINVQVKLEELYSQPAGTFNIVLDMEFEVR